MHLKHGNASSGGRSRGWLSFRIEMPEYPASALRLRYESAGTVEDSLSKNPDP